MGKVMINQGRSLPWTFRFVGIVAVFVLIMIVMQNLSENLAIWISIALSFLLPAIWFSNKILSIDNSSKEIHEGYWIMGFKTGKSKKFGAIEKTYINKVKTTQKMYSRANQGYDIKGVEYHAYIKLDDDEKIFLIRNKSEKRLNEKVTKIREKLGLT